MLPREKVTKRIWIKGGTGLIVYFEDRSPVSFSAHQNIESPAVSTIDAGGNTSNTMSFTETFTGNQACAEAGLKSCDGEKEIRGDTFLTIHSSEKQLAENCWSPFANVYWFK